LQVLQNQGLTPTDFTALVFGIKAKLIRQAPLLGFYFTALVFGIKAKQDSGGLVCAA
jgi:hypothetical protein